MTDRLVVLIGGQQVAALNLAAPFLRHPERLAAVLGDEVEEVLRVEAEVIGDRNYLGEPGTRGSMRTSADLGIWSRLRDGRTELLLVEVKFTERAFGTCRKGSLHGGSCDVDGPAVVASGGALCPLADAPIGRRYWSLIRDLAVFNPAALTAPGPCPFRHGGYQLMRNQVLAATIAADPDSGVDTARFAVLAHPDNREIRALELPLGGSVDVDVGWPAMLSDPRRFTTLDARAWVGDFVRDPLLAPWAAEMRARYFPGEEEARP